MGRKSEAKKLMGARPMCRDAGLSRRRSNARPAPHAEADKIGYPVLIKAAAGGGGGKDASG